jgi:hypothetical protein
LNFHYETQPLPTWLGWYAHQLPAVVQRVSVAAMFGVELLVPWLVFAGRKSRLAAFVPLVGLQLLIAATGNYAFFNLLTIALCLTLLDDAALPAWLRGRLPAASRKRPAASLARRFWRSRPSWSQPADHRPATGVGLPWPDPLVALYRAVAPFGSVNGYGLFA